MIARKSLLIVTSQFFNRFLGWIGLVILAKFWGTYAPEALGVIGFAMSFLAIFNIFADLGFNQAHVKRISEGKDIGRCIGTFIAIKLVLIVLMIVLVLSGIFIWTNILNGGFYDSTTQSVILVFLAYYVFFNLRDIAGYTFQGTKEIAKRQTALIFENLIKIPMFILVVFAGASIANISPIINWPEFLQPFQNFVSSHALGSLAMTYVFGIMATFIVGLFFLRKYPIKKPSWSLFKNYFVYAIPIMLISVIGIVSTNIDKIMIGYFWASKEVGYYYSVQQITAIIALLSTSVSVVLFPTLSEYHSKKNIAGVKRVTHQAERYMSMIIIPCIVVVIIFARPIINIMLDSAFLPAASVLITLTLYLYITSLMMPYSALIRGADLPNITAKIGFVMCIINISLNYFFIPEFGSLSSIGINGPTGAAVATLLSHIVGFVGLRVYAKKLTGIKIMQSHIPRHIIAGLVMAAILYYIGSLTLIIHWYHLLLFAGMGLAIYLGVLFVLKEFKKQDLMFFLDILRPNDMLKYIKSELKEK